MIMAAESYLRAGGSAKPEDIRKRLSGNLCRCTGYQHIVDSVAKTAKTTGTQQTKLPRKKRSPRRRTRSRRRPAAK
jgi:xanthine dehydrogenase iron-sulfur cluster and FAD-binding subunit A